MLAQVKASQLPLNQLLFSSFSLKVLRHLADTAQSFNRGLLLSKWRNHWQQWLTTFKCCALHINYQALTFKRAQAIKQAGYYLFCYTVNDVHKAKELLSFGVDGLFTDYPDKFLTLANFADK